ncbi:uncharacterized protein MELLADRAFT_95982 [Melampsora larici-populina 98AG31]|uniref:Uncharacterized protein n=1 Tax=Melampsora larici-populina (strain 98AG31 / pathotype 3-4-7) TaxID=747676 RepID=F4RDZ6_MELLP|nr:uncharacterized protein MELLADRAFT_95982 [Melampsora larici-populina 98AG31]EGG09493.1 hypothetical protein MELLADRAFT_95982 [Melampsora larici-populina 98AG31]
MSQLNKYSMANPWREEHDQQSQTKIDVAEDERYTEISQAETSCPVNDDVSEQITSRNTFDENVIRSHPFNTVGPTGGPERLTNVLDNYTSNETKVGYNQSGPADDALEQITSPVAFYANTIESHNNAPSPTGKDDDGYNQMDPENPGQPKNPPELYEKNDPGHPDSTFQPVYEQLNETQSALYQQLQSILADRRFQSQQDHSQQSSESNIQANYNPSIITPGAPSLPSARHRISTIPYHISPDHHTARLDILSRDGHSSRKRPQTFNDDDEQEPKRRCGNESFPPQEAQAPSEGLKTRTILSQQRKIAPLNLKSSCSGRPRLASPGLLQDTISYAPRSHTSNSRRSRSPPIASTSQAVLNHPRRSRSPPIASTSQALLTHSRRSWSPPIASTSRTRIPRHPGNSSGGTHTSRHSSAPHDSLPPRKFGHYTIPASHGSSIMSIDSSSEGNLTLPSQTRGSSRMSIDSSSTRSRYAGVRPRSREEDEMSLCLTEDRHGRQFTPLDTQNELPEDEFDYSDFEDNESDGDFDLAERQKYKAREAKSRTQKTKERQESTRLAKLSKNTPKCSPHEPLTRAIQDYVKLLFGIPRKRKGRNSDYLLPPPPSNQEYREWDQREVLRQEVVQRSILEARNRYRRKNPLATTSQLAIVEKLAAEKVVSNAQPVEFVSQVVLQNGRIGYSTSVAYTCERVLALAGFPRLAYDWLHSAKSSWNESVLAIISEEWEKCHRRGAADDYDINIKLVTSKNIRQILERWFNTKSREYVSQCSDEKSGADPAEAKEKLCKKASQKRLRRQVLEIHFKEHSDLRNILSHQSAHSEDEVDSDGTLYRIPKLWRSQDLVTLLNELDSLCITTQKNDQAKTTATKALLRGLYAEPGEADILSRPPRGFPRSLLDEEFMDTYVSRAEVAALDLSAKVFDLTPLIARTRWLLRPAGQP